MTNTARLIRRPKPVAMFGKRLNLLYLPAIVLFGIFAIYPLVNGVILAFTNWDGYSPDRDFVGLVNFARLLTDSTFHTALLNTLIYGFGSTLIQQVLGLGLALLLDRGLRGTSVARAVIYLPVLVSPVVMGAMYYLLFPYNNGALNDIVVAFGGDPVAWLSEPQVALWIIVVINSLQFYGVSMVIYLAGLQSIPTEMYEASSLDGATWWQQFRSITLPLLQPAFATSVVLNLIGGLKLYDVIQVLTGGGPGSATESVSTLISTAYFDNQSAGYASALGVTLFVMIAIFTLGLNFVLTRKQIS